MATKTYPSSKETINCARLCRLVTDICADVLREVLDQQILITDFAKELNKQPESFKYTRLNGSERAILYPAGGHFSGTYKDLDVSLLYTLLRNITKIPPPSTKWGITPASNDHSLAANIERIRIHRNTTTGHLHKTSVDDQTFKSLWGEIRQAIADIEKAVHAGAIYTDAVDHLEIVGLDPETEQMYIDKLDKESKTEIEIKDMIRNLGDDLSNAKDKLSGMENEIRNVEAFMTDLSTTTTSVDTNVLDVRENVSNLKEKLENVDTNANEMGEEIKSIKEHLTQNKQSKDTMGESLAKDSRLRSILVRTRKIIDYCRPLESFVKTSPFHESRKILRNGNILLLHGQTGEGKTMTAVQLMLEESNYNEDRCIIIELLSELNMISIDQYDSVLLDVCAPVFQHLNEIQKLTKKRPKFILTLDSDIYKKDLQMGLPRSSHISMHSENLLSFTFASILKQIAKCHNKSITEDMIKACVKKYSAKCGVGFPVICKLFCNIEPFFQLGSHFFEEIFKHLLEFVKEKHEKEPMLFFGLLLMALNEMKLGRENMEINSLSKQEAENLKDLEEKCYPREQYGSTDILSALSTVSYCLEQENGKLITFHWVSQEYEFRHKILGKAVLHYAMMNHPHAVIMHAKSSLLNEISLINEEKTSEYLKIGYDQFHWFSEKLISSVFNERSYTLVKYHKAFRNERFLEIFFNVLEEKDQLKELCALTDGSVALPEWVYANLKLKTNLVLSQTLTVTELCSLLNLATRIAKQLLKRNIFSGRDILEVTLQNGHLNVFVAILSIHTSFTEDDLRTAILGCCPNAKIFKYLLERVPFQSSIDKLLKQVTENNLHALVYFAFNGYDIPEILGLQYQHINSCRNKQGNAVFCGKLDTLTEEQKNILLSYISRSPNPPLDYKTHKPSLTNEFDLGYRLFSSISPMVTYISTVCIRKHFTAHCQMFCINSYDNDGKLLYLAAFLDSKLDIENILSRKISPDTRSNYARTPLMAASMCGHVETVSFLIGKGADVTAKDKDDNTSLHMCCMMGHLEVAKVILKTSNYINFEENKQGFSPVEYVAKYGHKDLFDYLISSECDNIMSKKDRLVVLGEEEKRNAGNWEILESLGEGNGVKKGSLSDYEELIKNLEQPQKKRKKVNSQEIQGNRS